MAESWRVTLGQIPHRLLGHGTGRDGRAIAFALAWAETRVLATASRPPAAFGGDGYPHSFAAVSSRSTMIPRDPTGGRPGGGW
jgi:hypothetical protein